MQAVREEASPALWVNFRSLIVSESDVRTTCDIVDLADSAASGLACCDGGHQRRRAGPSTWEGPALLVGRQLFF
jgi:hypothetical protein